uniref:Nucleic acid-binding proteins superfamily n=1 Tax=Davidia involucrata TaxID=16924 RepID=A0A5B7C8V5_DAVIN
MNSFADQVLTNSIADHEDSTMDIDHHRHEQEEEDQFLRFIDYAKSVLSPDEGESQEVSSGPGWNWIASRILRTCIAYSSGVTSAILLSDLSQAWNEQHRAGAPKKQPEYINQLKKKHKRAKLPNTVTIDSIYEKNFLSLSSVIEAVIVDSFLLPGTNIYMLSLGDFWSSNTIDLYLHRRFYNLADYNNGILKKGREIFLTGCYLRTASGGSGYSRLLPTEYLVILLDEDQDDDAMLLGAQFCSDSFSSISLHAVNEGISYSFYARIESIGSLEIQGKNGSLQRKQISLVDNDGVRLKFLLWGEQVILANLFSVGSMLAVDKPFVASSVNSSIKTCEEICLEYGSATHLFLVPFIQHEEQVCVALTQNRYQGSRLSSALDPSQGPKFSQVTLRCDSQGSIDFSNYPFRSFVIDLRDKMTSISLYGVVTDIIRERNTTESIFSLRIEDTTGAIWAKLHFVGSWSLGRLGLGHTVYISGLACSMTKQKHLEVLWFENDVGASLINLSCLPALLNSSCLHKSSYLSDLSSQTSSTHICRAWLDQIEHCHVNTRFSHARCGHFVNKTPCGVIECQFCQCSCDAEVVRTFHLKITLADESAKVLAWCTGQTATELLQISPDEFYELAEEEQIMYPSSLENERFTVAIVNCGRQDYGLNNSLNQEHDTVMWEITRALKCE